MSQSFAGLRARVLLLVLVAVVPSFLVIGYTAFNERRQAFADARIDARNLVQLATREQRHLIPASRQLLAGLARLPGVQKLAAGPCNAELAELHASLVHYVNLGVADLDGNIVCSAVPLPGRVNIADRGYFRRALRSGDMGVGDYHIGRVTGRGTLVFALPVTGPDGAARGVVFAALDLEWLSQLVTELDLPAGTVVTAADSAGTVLLRYPDSAQWVGRALPDAPLIAAMRRNRDEVVELAGLDGVTRLYAFAPLHSSDSGQVYVSAGISKEMAYGPANQTFARSLGLLAVVAVLALGAAWVGSDVFVLRRINALTAATRRLARGDWSARTGLPYGGGELSELARDFDTMAAALHKVNRALKTLSTGNRILVRATDERALLNDMCRQIVEIGGYRCAWVGVVDGPDAAAVRPVAQAGFAAGLAALAALVGALGPDRCPALRALRSGTLCTARDLPTRAGVQPPDEQATQCGFAAAIAFPLQHRDQTVGVLTIYAAELDAFNAEEIDLLHEAAADLAFGITTLRLRAEHQRAHREIERAAFHDRLTGLPNHMAFEAELQRRLAPSSPPQPYAVLLLGLDRFREINDALGYRQGDRVLIHVAQRLREVLQGDQPIARIHGDQFIILWSVNDPAEAGIAAATLLAAIARPVALDGLVLDVSATIGISLCPQHGSEAERLIRHANVALHHAKRSGERFAFYDVERDRDDPRRLALIAELRGAIDGDQLVLYYQPKVDLRSGRLCGVEALVRWLHPQHGLIPPDTFVPLAEHTGLIRPMTDWVIQAALRQSAVWRRAGLTIPIAVNLSARSLRDREFLDKVQRLFAAGQADGDWLEFEITESAIMEDPEQALALLERLHEQGIALFIDDFGTGYSSLGYLQKLPVDAVKIDKSFVKAMMVDADSAAIVRSTISLAHDLGIQTVAEGVEDRAAWDCLAGLDCDAAQGYFIAKPMPADRFESWYADYSSQPPLGTQTLIEF